MGGKIRRKDKRKRISWARQGGGKMGIKDIGIVGRGKEVRLRGPPGDQPDGKSHLQKKCPLPKSAMLKISSQKHVNLIAIC